jgi:serine/threonine protein kinase/predicted ATPase/Tfp pilus assembly protein PilF
MSRAPGDRLGPYSLVRPLGQGGTGEVWEALLHGPGGFEKPVACKLVRPDRVAGPGVRESLLREARLGARLHHPNVVGTYAVAEHADVLLVVLELVRGVTLHELLRATGPLPARAVLDVGVQVAAALAHLHAAGLVHRDVKPGNLMVDAQGVVKLTDLGISVLAGEGGPAAGTLGYAAPEQVRGESTPASDVFALGVVSYVLATARRPLGADPARARVGELLLEPGFLSPVEAAAPGLADLVRRCLQPDPGLRPTAAALGLELAALRAQQAPGPSLRDLVARVRPELRSDAPSGDLASTSVALRGNLPRPREPLVGRQDELRELRTLLLDPESRLVVLLGPGGAGKTRLSFEVARALATLPGGAWAFDLTEARTADGICQAVARALPLELERRDPAGQLGRVLGAKGRALVVLDNLEQCVAHLPETLGRWLDLAPDAVFLGTSRVAPGLTGERRVALGPLLPADAEALFRARAGPSAAGDGPRVAALCAALEGMPLPIELAAARVGLMGLERLVARLTAEVSLPLLAGGRRDLPPRQRSVEASLDWSAELLSPAGRDGWWQLAVFEGGATLEAAEAVLDVDGAVLDVLQELVDASLVRVDRAAMRFVLPVVVREYAVRKAHPAVVAAAEVRHGAFFAQLGGDDPDPGSAAVELDNLLAAVRRAVARGDGPTAVGALQAAWSALGSQGPFAAGEQAARAVLGLAGLPPHLEGHAADVLGRALARVGRPDEAARALQRALELFRGLRDRRAEGLVLGHLGSVDHERGRTESAGEAYHLALTAVRAVGDRRLEGTVLANLGALQVERGRFVEAQVTLEEALAVLREVGSRRVEGTALGALGIAHRAQGRPEEALRCYELALAAHREVGNRRHEAITLGNLANLRDSQGRTEEAQELGERAIAQQRELGDRRSEGIALANLGYLHLKAGRSDQALPLLERALALDREVDNPISERIVLMNLSELHLRAGRPERARDAVRQALALVPSGDRAAEAAARARRACIEVVAGDRPAAEAQLARAESLVAGLDGSAALEARLELDEARRALGR